MVAVLASGGGSGWYLAGGLGLLLWIVLLIFLGIKTLRKGHWVLFLIGLLLPVVWVLGAILPPRR